MRLKEYLTEHTEYDVPRWLDMLYTLFEGKPFFVMMILSFASLYMIRGAWLIFGTFCLLMLIKAILEVPDGAGFIIGCLGVFTLILFFIPLILVTINYLKFFL